RLTGHFETLLRGIVANPKQRIGLLPLMSTAEHQNVLTQWNQTKTDYPQNQCIHHLFEEQVVRSPDAIALSFETEQFTYQQLNSQANQLAHHLQSLGVGPEVLVGICVDRSPDMLIGMLAIFKAGGSYIPLDPAYPGERLAYMVEDSKLSVLLLHTPYQAVFNAALQKQSVQIVDISSPIFAQQPNHNPTSSLTAQNLAYTIYTSGSTGKPKGVQIEHGSVVNFLYSMRDKPGLTSQDRLLAVTTISFDIAVLELYLPLMVGAQVILASREVTADGRQLAALLSHSAATVMQATPVTWQMLLTSGWTGNATLKMLCGGEALPRALANQLLEKGETLWNLYGPTEATVWTTACRVTAGEGPVPVAEPVANTQLYVVERTASEQAGIQDFPNQDLPEPRILPVGIPGEVYIGGDGLARGYLNRPDLTAAKFIPDPFSDKTGARLYKTGDLARFRPDGRLEFLGRIDHQIKIRGFRIELGEIETAFSQNPAVQQCVVVAQAGVQGDKRLVAYWVAKSDARPTPGEFREQLEGMLPNYMIPSVFVCLEAFPLTPNGKLNRRALPAPQMTNIQKSSAYVAPRTLIEQQLADIWKDILGLNQVGVHDNFFELGGHSFLAAQVVAQVQTICQVQLPLVRLFESPTIDGLAKLCQLASRDAATTAMPDSDSLLVLLKQGNPAHQPLFLVHEADGDISLYGNLSHKLKGDRTVYGITPRASAGTPMVHSRIKAIAADYCQQIQMVQPEGPYLLGGLCIGGVIA
ncbi:MAG: amino acid adenylation domain-containing protein, partial [Cyanobacteria bacterium J06635_11]